MLKEYKYNILIISQNDMFNNQISKMFPPEIINILDYASNCALSRRMILERNYEILIINSPLNDENGISLAIDAVEINKMGVILFTPPQKYDEYYDKTHEFGILTLSNTVSNETFLQTLRLLLSTRQRIERIVEKKLSLSERMAEIRILSEAKLALIDKYYYTEDDAHKYIEKNAMNKRITLVESARQILEEIKVKKS